MTLTECHEAPRQFGAKDFPAEGLMNGDGLHWGSAAQELVGYDVGTTIMYRCFGGG